MNRYRFPMAKGCGCGSAWVRSGVRSAGESSSAYESRGGVEAHSRNFAANANKVVDPDYSDPDEGDYTLSPQSRCPLAGQGDRPAFSGPGP